MHTLGKILIIWGALLPLVALPSIDFGPNGVVPLLNFSLQSVEARIGWMNVSFDRVLVWAVLLVGLGLSACITANINDELSR